MACQFNDMPSKSQLKSTSSVSIAPAVATAAATAEPLYGMAVATLPEEEDDDEELPPPPAASRPRTGVVPRTGVKPRKGVVVEERPDGFVPGIVP